MTSPNSNEIDPSIDRAARLLIEARESGTKLDGFPADVAPASTADAEAIDDRVAELTGWEVVGWKIGCTSEHAQKLLGSPGPFAGRVYRIVNSGFTVEERDAAESSLLEGELAFRLGRDLPANTDGVGRTDVVAAIDCLLPAIEVVGGRFAEFIGTPVNSVAADSGGNTLLVVGEPAPSFDADELAEAAGSMTVNDEQTGAGTGADVLGSPITALVWLVDHLGSRGIDLHAGQVVTTGTLTQVTSLPRGATAVADFGPLGQATITRS